MKLAAETVREAYAFVLDLIDEATEALWEAEALTVGLPMCHAESARISLLDARESWVHRLVEMVARYDGAGR